MVCFLALAVRLRDLACEVGRIGLEDHEALFTEGLRNNSLQTWRGIREGVGDGRDVPNYLVGHGENVGWGGLRDTVVAARDDAERECGLGSFGGGETGDVFYR